MKLGKFVGLALMALTLGLAGQSLAAEPIKIGVYLPLTGQNAFGGQLELEGVQLALKDMPEVLGRPIELVVVDNMPAENQNTRNNMRLLWHITAMRLFYILPLCVQTIQKANSALSAIDECVRTSPFKPWKCPKKLAVLLLSLTAWCFWNACPICWQTRCFQATQQPILYPLYYSKSDICKHTVSI